MLVIYVKIDENGVHKCSFDHQLFNNWNELFNLIYVQNFK